MMLSSVFISATDEEDKLYQRLLNLVGVEESNVVADDPTVDIALKDLKDLLGFIDRVGAEGEKLRRQIMFPDMSEKELDIKIRKIQESRDYWKHYSQNCLNVYTKHEAQGMVDGLNIALKVLLVEGAK